MYREKLVQFEKAKAQKLYEAGLIDKTEDYFNKEDEADIMSLDEQEAEGIYNKICEWVNDKLGIGGLRVGYSSFCLYILYTREMSCDECGFGKRHGKCGDEGSVFYKIDKQLKAKGLRTDNILTSDFYKNLIKRIEEAQNGK